MAGAATTSTSTASADSSSAAAPSVVPSDWTFADLWASLGGIPLERIRAVPPPGTATEDDVVRAESYTDVPCELIDGVLVEKTMGYLESIIAMKIVYLLMAFTEKNDLGVVLGPGGTLRVLPQQVRIPDVCFISWARFPNRQLPSEPIPALAPDLAIEVLSPGNTEAEMQRKLRDYFTAGVRMVWYVDPRAARARSYTAADQFVEAAEGGALSGGDVLPGFELPLAGLFAKPGAK